MDDEGWYLEQRDLIVYCNTPVSIKFRRTMLKS